MIASKKKAISTLLDKDRTMALLRARALMDLYPTRSDVALLYGAASSLLQDYDTAKSVLHPFWAQTADPQIGFNFGYCERQLGNYAEALTLFLKALALTPDDISLRALAADTSLILGDKSFAKRILASRDHPVLAMRMSAMPDSTIAPHLPPDQKMSAVAFWNKYDCHLFQHLDHKGSLARLLGPQSEFWPTSYILPDQWEQADQAIQKSAQIRWLFKPMTESGGRGIHIPSREASVKGLGAGVIQKLIEPPFLYHGRKMNIRLFVTPPSSKGDPARVWHDGLVYFSTANYDDREQSGPGIIANLLQTDPTRLMEPLGALPHHVIPLRALGRVLDVPALSARLHGLVRGMVNALEQRGFWASVGRISPDFMPHFVGLDIGLDETGTPWLFEIERYPGVGGVSPVNAHINHRFCIDWAAWLNREPRADEKFIPV